MRDEQEGTIRVLIAFTRCDRLQRVDVGDPNRSHRGWPAVQHRHLKNFVALLLAAESVVHLPINNASSIPSAFMRSCTSVIKSMAS